MKLKDTGLTFQDIKDKVNKYMIETYERFDFLAETAQSRRRCLLRRSVKQSEWTRFSIRTLVQRLTRQ